MISQELNVKAEQARRDGYVILSVEEGPVRLHLLVEFAQSLFPNHRLDQLAITQAEDDQFVIAAELGTSTKPS
jgi:hypothetical protein